MKQNIKNQEKPCILHEALCFVAMLITAIVASVLPIIIKQANTTVQVSL